MKQLLAIPLLFSALSTFAIVRTVSNTPSTLAQFNTIQAAVDASANGDSIYVHGSQNQYSAFTQTNKQLTIIGPGWAVDKNMPFAALIQGCNISGLASSNSEYQGLTFIGSGINTNNVHPNNLRFIRNQFSHSIHLQEGSTTYSGYLFEGNFFDNATINAATNSTYQNFLFQNNYFYESGAVDGNFNGFFNSINVVFNHNLWFGPGSGTRNVGGVSNRSLIFTNNIFVRRNPANNISVSVFNNNITFNAGTNNPWAVNSNVNNGGNVENQDPQMAAQASVNAGTNNPLADFTIVAGPAKNTGSDGKDMGLLYDVSGILNFANSRNSRLPRINSMNVVNPTVAAGNNITINVEAKISN